MTILLFRTKGNISALMLLLVIFISSAEVYAVPYYGEETFTYHQPDGATFPVKLYGDEFFAYQRTLDGYEVTLDEASGFWCYAALSPDGRSFLSTGVPVITKRASSAAANKSRALTLETMSENQKLPAEVVIARVREAQTEQRVDAKGRPLRMDVLQSGAKTDIQPGPPSRTTVGDYTGLCILVDFYDEPGTISTAQVDAYCNQPSGYTEFGNACSINEYFHIQSNGRFNFFNTVVGYVRMPLPKTYYDNNRDGYWGNSTAQDLVSTALNILIAQGFDFTTLSRDSYGYIYSINVFYAGICTSGWSLGLWPHSWAIPTKVVDTTNNIMASNYQMTDMEDSLRIGTFCHENGHMTCEFPDLYSYIDGQGIVGYYSLMCASGSTHPRNIDPYLKYKAGWADVVEVTAASNVRAVAQIDRNFYYKFTNPLQNSEYFLIENRDDIGYEGAYGGAGACAPGQGLVVWHIYEQGSNTYSSIQATPQTYQIPYEALIIEASPTTSYTPWYSNPDPWPGSSDTFYSGHGADPLNDASSPNLRFWNHALDNGLTVNSNFVVGDYAVQDAAVAYTIGSGAMSGTPAIGSTATSISAACDFGANPMDFVFSIYNGAGGTLNYSISDNAAWLNCTPAAGSLTTTSDAITVTFDAAALTSGSYNAAITVTATGASNTPQIIPVTLTVADAPVLLVSPTTINESLLPLGISKKKYFSISNGGGGSMAYTVSTVATWMIPRVTTGQCANETDLVYLDIDAIGLPIGLHSEEIEVSTAGETRYVTIYLSVHESLPVGGGVSIAIMAFVVSVLAALLLRRQSKKLS
jgi:M6 family metalloprotease-like protein